MQLPFFHKTENSTEREYLLALEISPGVIKSAIWTVVNGTSQVLVTGRTQPWDNTSSNSLVVATDASISGVAQNYKIEKVIFGLSSDWLAEDKIDSEKMAWLRQLSGKLELKPVGYVVTHEAITKFIQHSEGMPPTAILLGFWPHVLELTLVRLGKIDGAVSIARSQNLTDDVIEGLSRLPKVDMLPSRMLLYDSGIDLEEVKQLLLTYPWLSPTRKFGFLHFPKVEILPADFTVRAIALSGGEEVAKSIGLIKPEDVVVEETKPNFGFTAEDVMSATPTPSISVPEPEPVYEVVEPIVPKKKFTLPTFSMPKVPSFSLPNFGNWKLVVFGICGLGLVVWAMWFLPKATISIITAEKMLEHSFSATIATSDVDASATVTDVAAATGSKNIGDKAKGIVTIYNRTTTSRTFVAGTQLSSPSGLKFVLDSQTQVASASGTAADPASKTTANVTAVAIGTDSNIPTDTSLQIGTLAVGDIVAKNDAAFSGGTSRQVKSVSKADVDGLRTKLLDLAKTQSRQQLDQKITDGQMLISETVTYTTSSEEWNHKIDEAADNVQLKLTVKAKGLLTAKSELNDAINKEINPLVPSGYTISEITNQKFTFKKTGAFDVFVIAKLLPTVDVSEMAKMLSGKKLEQAKEYIQTVPSVTSVNFSISPSLPFVNSRLPWISSHIKISVASQ